jgi:hypothetical protein
VWTGRARSVGEAVVVHQVLRPLRRAARRAVLVRVHLVLPAALGRLGLVLHDSSRHLRVGLGAVHAAVSSAVVQRVVRVLEHDLHLGGDAQDSLVLKQLAEQVTVGVLRETQYTDRRHL